MLQNSYRKYNGTCPYLTKEGTGKYKTQSATKQLFCFITSAFEQLFNFIFMYMGVLPS